MSAENETKAEQALLEAALAKRAEGERIGRGFFGVRLTQRANYRFNRNPHQCLCPIGAYMVGQLNTTGGHIFHATAARLEISSVWLQGFVRGWDGAMNAGTENDLETTQTLRRGFEAGKRVWKQVDR